MTDDIPADSVSNIIPPDQSADSSANRPVSTIPADSISEPQPSPADSGSDYTPPTTIPAGSIRRSPARDKVKRVIDGGTLELANGQIVRYVGINAPNNGEPFEEKATEANAKLVQNKIVSLEYDTYTSDRFGRVLAYAFVDGKNVSGELVWQGLAKVTIYQDRRKLKYRMSS